jgi:hypothetical protein
VAENSAICHSDVVHVRGLRRKPFGAIHWRATRRAQSDAPTFADSMRELADDLESSFLNRESHSAGSAIGGG